MKLNIVETEAANCLKVFESVEIGAIVMHCHHDKLMERLTEPAEARIDHILASKPEEEQALRLRLFRPAPKGLIQAYDDYKAKRKSLDDDYKVKFKLLNDEYEAKLKPLYDEYAAKIKPLYNEYWAKRKLLYDEYEAKLKPLNDTLFRAHLPYCPDCPWDGKTIFGEAKG